MTSNHRTDQNQELEVTSKGKWEVTIDPKEHLKTSLEVTGDFYGSRYLGSEVNADF